jgi:hypothetical protein
MPTPNTGIPYVAEGTQDPAAGLNLSLNVIDALLQTAVLNMNLTAPPGSPADGDLHIVASGATGAWAGEDNNLARYVSEGAFWQFYEAGVNVFLVLNKDDGALYAWNGSVWDAPIAGGGGTSPIGRHMVPVMAASMAPKQTGGCAALATFSGASGQPDVAYLAFDPSTEEHAQFAIAMPPSWDEGTVTFVPRWMHPAAATNFGVCWKLRAVAVSNDDSLVASFGTAQSSVDTGGTTSDAYAGPESAAITIAGTPQPSDLVLFDFYRDPLDAGDTLAVDAWLVGIDFYITTAAATD